MQATQLDVENFPRIQKKDGREMNFDMRRLARSLWQANDDKRDQPKLTRIIQNLWTILENESSTMSTQQLDQLVDEQLEAEGLFKTIQCRKQFKAKQDAQEAEAKNMEASLNKLIERDQTVVNENANKDSQVFNTQRDLTAGTVSRAIGLNMYPEHVAKAHIRGDIHLHDLDYSPYSAMTNCCLIDFEEMLGNGFKLGNAEVETPKSIQTATAQIAQIIANVSSSQYGGCSADRLDEVLAPYAEKNYQKHLADAKQWVSEDKQEDYAKEKTRKDIYDAMQSLEYEINTLFTSNGQTPFTSVGFGLGTNWFEREIQKAILQIRINGLGKEHRTAIFPKLIFTLKRGLNLNEGDPNYDIKQLALECATKRMYPDILSYDKIVDITGSFKVPMGCRSFLPGWWDEDGNEVNAGRMNLGVVTLNLPRIALASHGDKAYFWQLFDEKMQIVKDALAFRTQRCCEAKPENAPILYMNGAFGKRLEPGDDVNQLFNHERCTVSIGYIGLYEVATEFYGPDWEHNVEAKEFTLDIMKALKHYADQWTKETGYWYSIYSTPSESLTDRFCRLDTEKFGKVADITDKEYYTNSFHYDVRKKPTPFEKLEFEKDYPQYAAGGFIHYCEYPVLQQNPKALEAVWDFAYDRIGYLGTNTPIDHCYECGYDGDFEPTERGFKCPQCGNDNPETCDVVKRTCGYLGNPQARPMVNGRHKEISARVKHC